MFPTSGLERVRPVCDDELHPTERVNNHLFFNTELNNGTQSLCFNGQGEAAFTFHEKRLGRTKEMKMRVGKWPIANQMRSNPIELTQR